MTEITKEFLELARADAVDLGEFIYSNPSPFHVIENCRQHFLERGFVELDPRDSWRLSRGSKYFTTVNRSTFFGFSIGGSYSNGNSVTIVGTHSDSPCPKLKPNSYLMKDECLMLAIQLYGGGNWNTWFDRALKLAGRVIAKDFLGNIGQYLVNFDRPIMTIPHLAIHLERSYADKLEFNKETQFVPLMATKLVSDLYKVENGQNGVKLQLNHSEDLMRAIAEEIGVPPQNIIDMELSLADTQRPQLFGLYEEFLSCPRLDNQFNTFCAMMGFLLSLEEVDISSDPYLKVYVTYDNEEVGSKSAQGAASANLENILKRIFQSLEPEGLPLFEDAMAKSILISADQNHGSHPNYLEKYAVNNSASFHSGCLLAHHAGQNFATSSLTASVLKEIAKIANVPVQDTAGRNDLSSGSTIGPHLAAQLGIHTVDVGFPMLAMHSAREMCDVSIVRHAILLYKTAFKEASRIVDSMSYY